MKEGFWDHLEALRRTLLWVLAIMACGFLVCFYFYPQIYKICFPLNGQPLVLLSPLEGLTVTFRVAFYMGVALTAPFWLWMFFRFLQPALKSGERSFCLLFIVVSLFSLALGFFAAITFTIPLANEMLYAFNETIGQNLWTLSEYFSFSALVLLGNVLLFQFIGLLGLLVHFGYLSPETMVEWRRVSILSFFILATLITPPDVPTQLAVAIPLVLCYELGILYGKVARPSRPS